MKLIIHRGSKEIGGSCVEIQSVESRILIDFGLPLVDSNKNPFDPDSISCKPIEELKKDKILPDIRGLYKNENPQFDGILISHSHLDHYGLLDFANEQIPVYISEGAKELVDVTNIFSNKNIHLSKTIIIKNESPLYIKDLKITPYLVDHSAFDAFAFLIESEGQRLFYSGDFRGHGRKGKLFELLIRNPPKDIDCLLMEGSLLGRKNLLYKNEKEIQGRIAQILNEQSNITFLFASSQNIDRLVSAYKACLKTKATFVIDIYTAFILHRLAKVSQNIPQWNWNNIRVKFFHYHASKLADAGLRGLLYVYNRQKIEMDEINEKRNKILMLARDNSIFPHIIKNLSESKGAKIIYSMWEGYLKEEFKKYCHDKQIDIEAVHTSGHAALKDLHRFAKALNPKVLVPIHTFEPKTYAELFENSKIVNDGELFSIYANRQK